jgi:hypothetical protein
MEIQRRRRRRTQRQHNNNNLDRNVTLLSNLQQSPGMTLPVSFSTRLTKWYESLCPIFAAAAPSLSESHHHIGHFLEQIFQLPNSTGESVGIYHLQQFSTRRFWCFL